MKYLKTICIIGLIAIGFFILPSIAAQQPNEYRAYVSNQFIDSSQYANGTVATMVMKVTYVPIYPSATYTLTEHGVYVLVDLSQPTSINTQIATVVNTHGETLGYDVIRVYVPSYDMKVT